MQKNHPNKLSPLKLGFLSNKGGQVHNSKLLNRYLNTHRAMQDLGFHFSPKTLKFLYLIL